MTTTDLVCLRLHHQQLVQPQFKTPAEIVRWLGAVQAQDYLHTLWGIGQRLENVTEPDIEKAVSKKLIVRSWPMRGTLHFVPTEDLRWMLRHLTPRIVKKYTTMFRKEGLDKSVFTKSRKIVIDALQGGHHLTREELYAVLEEKKISTKNVRGLHITFVLAQEGIICFGPRQGKQQTFVLLDEWLPPTNEISFDEALGKVALGYFTSHGPAQISDLAWWAGLTQAEAKGGLESIKSKLVRETSGGREYWLSPDIPSGKTIPNLAHLISVYDEYTIAYKDRSALANGKRTEKLKARDFLNMMTVKGRVVGVWKRTLEKKQVVIDVSALTPLSATENSALQKAAALYGKFLGLTPQVNVRKF